MKLPHAKFGYDNYSDLLRKNVNKEIIEHAKNTYDKWTKYLLKHVECPKEITELYAKSTIWYQRIAAVFPKNKFVEFKYLLKNDKDKRVRNYLNRAEEINWPNMEKHNE